MATSVKTRLIKIGNSQGIRIPKLLIDQVGLDGEIELELQNGQLIVRPSRSVRQGWDERFIAMAAAGDDSLLDGDVKTSGWEVEEWDW